MESLAAAARTAYAERLDQEQFDVLVIGGGITGAGVALDAAARGYRVALVEKADFASGTSSKSTKLAHGGIRYLPQFVLAMIQEGVIERGLMVRHAPFLDHSEVKLRSEEHTSELQSQSNLVCRLLL